SFERFSVIGAGAWGTALAMLLAGGGRPTSLWARSPAAVETMAGSRQSPRLPGIALDPAIAVTADLARAGAADAILMVVPAQVVRDMARALAPHVAPRTPIVICS